MLFNRIANVVIYPASGGAAISISDLRIAFNVSKKLSSDPNTAKISIFNLSESTREKIKETDSRISLSCGYVWDTGAELVFDGDITMVTHDHEGTEVITRIEAQDGGKAIRTKKTSVSYKDGTGIKQMISDAVESLGLPVKIPVEKLGIPNVKISNSEAFSGNSRTLLDRLLPQAGFQWTVSNGILNMIPIDGTDDSKAVSLSSDSGMIGSPKKITVQVSGKDTFGWEVSSLLRGKILPGGKLSLESKIVKNGPIFKIIEVEHDGDTDGDAWNTVSRVIVI